MSDIERATKAFQNAIASGDEAAAREIAKAIKTMQAIPPERKPVSDTGGMSAHAATGFLFGAGDEYLAGLSALMGLQPDGNGGARWLDFDKPISQRYDTALEAIRSEMGQYAEDNPVKATTAMVGGGIAGAVTGARAAGALGLSIPAAATMPGRVGQVAAGGVAGGGIEGFLSGEGGFGNRLKSGGIGAAVGGVLAPAIGIPMAKVLDFAVQKGGQALRTVFANNAMFDRTTGEITDAGRKRLAALGVNADELTDEMQQAFGVAAGKAAAGEVTDPAAVARMARAERFGIPITSGQATGSVPQIAAEEGYRAGVRGQRALQVMDAFDTTQRNAVEDARDMLGKKVAGEAVDRVDAADAVISGVQREAAAARLAGKQAYDILEANGAGIGGNAVANLGKRIQNNVRMTGFEIGPDTPNSRAAIGFLQETFDKSKSGSVPFMNIERARQQLLRLERAARAGANGADQVTMSTVVQEFDGWIEDTVTEALIQGDQGVLTDAKAARELWGKYRQTFLSRDGADNFIRKIVEDDLSPDQVAGWLYGAATTPGGGQTALVAKRVRDILGPDSAEWKMVKRAAWDHVTKAPEGKAFGPQKVVSGLAELVDGKGKALSRELFNPTELNQIREFRNMLQVLVPPQKATNPSGSGYEIQRGMMNLFGMMLGSGGGPVGAVAGRAAVSSGTDFVGGLSAKAAARGIVPRPTPGSMAVGAGIGASGALQEQLIR